MLIEEWPLRGTGPIHSLCSLQSDESKTQAFRRRAKSHAIRQALLKKRRLQGQSTPLASAERARDQCLQSSIFAPAAKAATSSIRWST